MPEPVSPNADPKAEAPVGGSLNLWQAIALNVSNIMGAGPFISIPIFLSKMAGPEVMVAWILAAILVICDGMVWAELGAAIPKSGGTYQFLRHAFSPYRLMGLPVGRWLAFLAVWQFMVFGAMELASGYVGGVKLLLDRFPGLEARLGDWQIPLPGATIPALLALLVAGCLCGPTRRLGAIGLILGAGAIATLLVTIACGWGHGDYRQLVPRASAWKFDRSFTLGLASAMSIAVYDYLGYYNICFLGREVAHPRRNIPRAVIGSVCIAAALYFLLSSSVVCNLPWEIATNKEKNVVAEYLERLQGPTVANWMLVPMLWTVIAGCFAMTLAYSRIPYAAALDGDFFRVFGRLDSRQNYPVIALPFLGITTALCCFFSLDQLIELAVALRVLTVFITQSLAVILLRRQKVELPFRMRFFPLPVIIALTGWTFLFCFNDWQLIFWPVLLGLVGTVVFWFSHRRTVV